MPEAEGSTSAPPHAFAARSWLLPISLGGLLLRLAVALLVIGTHTPQWLFSQATELGCMATSLLDGQGFASPFCGHTGPSAFLAPGYPFFVAVVFRGFGRYTQQSAAALLLVQTLLSAGTVPVAMWTARRAFGPRTAMLTGLLCAFNPWLIGLETVFWETTASILLLTSLLGMAFALRQQPTRARWYLAAALLGLAYLINPSLVLSSCALLFSAWLLGPPGSRTFALPAFAVAFVVCSLWPIRNLRVLHAAVPFRSNMGYELWQGNRPGADGFFQAALHPNVDALEYDRYQAAGELAYMREKSTLATEWIRSHPWRFTALTLKRVACFWSGAGRTPSPGAVAFATMLSLAGFAGLFGLRSISPGTASLFALPLLLLPLPYYISHPDFRFWCLLSPVLSMLEAWGISQVAERAGRSGAQPKEAAPALPAYGEEALT